MRKLSVRNLCVLGMLVALTVVLSIFTTWKIGSTIKISLKFSSVYVSAVIFGPLLGGLVGVLSDVASFIANPVAGFIPLVTVIEFVIGMVYGLFFKNVVFDTPKIPRTVVCCAVQSVFTDAVFKSLVLSYSFSSDFLSMLISRIPAVGINFSIQVIVISVLNIYMEKFKSICYK